MKCLIKKCLSVLRNTVCPKACKSIEAIQKRERELEIRDARRGELWLKWSIGIAVFVVLGLIILMIAFSS